MQRGSQSVFSALPRCVLSSSAMCLRLSRLEIGRPGAGLIGVGEIVDFGAVFRSHSAIKRFRVRIRVLGRLLGLPLGGPWIVA